MAVQLADAMSSRKTNDSDDSPSFKRPRNRTRCPRRRQQCRQRNSAQCVAVRNFRRSENGTKSGVSSLSLRRQSVATTAYAAAKEQGAKHNGHKSKKRPKWMAFALCSSFGRRRYRRMCRHRRLPYGYLYVHWFMVTSFVTVPEH